MVTGIPAPGMSDFQTLNSEVWNQNAILLTNVVLMLHYQRLLQGPYVGNVYALLQSYGPSSS